MLTSSSTTRSRRRTHASSLALTMAVLPALPAIGQTTATWLNAVDGNWTDPTKWSTNPSYPNNGVPAGSTYQAVIGASGTASYSVVLQNNIAIDGLTLNSANATFLQATGNLTMRGTLDIQAGTFQASGGWFIGGRIQAEAGQMTLKNLDGNPTVFQDVTLAAPVTSTWSNPFIVYNQLTLDGGSISLVNQPSNAEGALLWGKFGPMTIGGTGAIYFDSPNNSDYGGIITHDGLVTIGPGVSINTRTGGGSIGACLNLGTINVSTSALYLTGTWTNSGRINLSGGSLVLGGKFATSDIGQLVRTGGGLAITGTVNNTGQVLDLSHLGSIGLAGSITGGLITTGSSTASLSLVGNTTLDGVTLDADLSLPQIYYLQQLTIANGLTLQNNHSIRITMGGTMDVTPVTGYGQIIVDGIPDSSGYSTAIDGVINPNITVTTGIAGSSIFAFDGTNHGSLLVQTPGIPLRLVGGWSNAGGVIKAFNGGAIELNANPGSFGNFTVNGATLSITTGITTAQLAQIGTTNAAEILGSGGVLDNNGAVFSIGGNGNTFLLDGGQINGGIVTAAVPGVHLRSVGTPVYLPVGYLPTTSIASNITFSLPVDIDDRATLGAIGTLTLNGIDISLGGSSSLTLSTLALSGAGTSAASIAGQGSIIFNGTGPLNAVTATTALTIGPGITIRTGSGGGSVGGLHVPVINQGLISSRTPGRTLTVMGSAYGLNNQSVMEAVNGGSLVLNGLTNNATVNASGSGSVTLGGLWSNAGTITIADTARLVLGGTFRATSDLGTINLVPGSGTSIAATIMLNGTMNNASNVFSLSSLGTGTLLVGTNAAIVGGTVTAGAVSGARLTNAPSAAANLTLTGVTLAAPLSLNNGGSLTFNGSVLDTDLVLPSPGTLTISGGLTLLNRQITADVARINFSGSNLQTLGGSGSLTFGGSTTNLIQSLSTNAVTFGPGILVHGKSLTVQGGTGFIINQGTIAADVAGGLITLNRVSNQGTIEALGGGSLILNNVTNTATGLIVSSGTGTITFGPNWHNAGGTVSLSASTVNLAGTFLPSDLTSFSNPGGNFVLSGTFSNQANTLILGGNLGNWTIAGGTVRGGIVASSGGATMTTASPGATFDTVTFDNTAKLLVNANSAFTNAATNHGSITVVPTSGSVVASFAGPLTGSGNITIGAATGTAAVVNVTSIAQSSVTINNTGSLVIATNAARLTQTLGTLSLSGNALLNIANHDVVVDGNYTAVNAAVRQAAGAPGSNGLNPWTGVGGITSTPVKTDAAQGNPGKMAIGFKDNADYVASGNSGKAVAPGKVLVSYAAYGDANLDNTVDITDLSIWNNNFATGDHWGQGDFNYDGHVDIADLSVWNNNFAGKVSPSTAAAAPRVTFAASPRTLSGSTAVGAPAAPATPPVNTLELDIDPTTGDAVINSGGVSIAAVEIDSTAKDLISANWKSFKNFYDVSGWSFTKGTPSSAVFAEFTSDASSSGSPIALAAGSLTDYGNIVPIGFSNASDLTFKYNIVLDAAGNTQSKVGNVVIGVPEPSSLGELALAGFGLLSRRRRHFRGAPLVAVISTEKM